ncbi:oligosaccharide flippase family protein [Tuanshanicoccus lijuaniae]|uniref:oligosaccharide flippase family protein n=1 Tax=Aerococcaceae bacterium zg-1292 TaxID=2774330 RepID=UPI0019373C35|nr:oligosaccharide flippase family protein [Aerococcaceae bacterium zg-1292]QQA36624.1 oligosaccharide flippase family protein [Aerococcaceae bacterium zg-1292]
MNKNRDVSSKKDQKKILLYNTIFLYVLKFSNVFLSLITVPYQARVLGVNVYGELGIATAIMTYFTLIIDFGFTLSATAEVANSSRDDEEISKIFASVNIIKILLSILSIIGLEVLFRISDGYARYGLMYRIFLIATLINGFLPDYIYRGLENMKVFTYRTIIVRVLFTLLLFIFLKSSDDYLVVPCALLIGNLVAVIWAFIDLKIRYSIPFFVCVSKKRLMKTFLDASEYFLSRIISGIYTTLNTLVLGAMDPTRFLSGIYSAAFKLIQSGQSMMGPIADSIYPYMIVNKDLRLIKKILKFSMPVISLGCLILFTFSDFFITLLYGKEYIMASKALKAMIPGLLFTFPDYLLGFPALTAIGMQKHANYSIYFSFSFYILGIILLKIFHIMNIISLSMLFSSMTIIETMYRFTVVYKNKKLYL